MHEKSGPVKGRYVGRARTHDHLPTPPQTIEHISITYFLHQCWHLVAILGAGIAYIYKKAVDVAADLAKERLKNRPPTTQASIYGPDGQVIKRVKKD